MIEHIFIHISWKNSIIKQTILFCEINAQNPITFFFSRTLIMFSLLAAVKTFNISLLI